MLLILALAIVVWLVARRLGVPADGRWLLLALLYVVVLAVNVALPAGNPLKEATGGSAGEWLVLGGLGVLGWAYSLVLRRVRARVRPENRAPIREAGTFGAGEIDRYARHIALREIGGAGQRRLKQARVLVVGAGGLGSPALLYLAGAGVGTLGVIDDDVVESTNLQRQIIHADARIGSPKVFSAEAGIRALNPNVAVRPYNRRLTDDIAEALFGDYDMILDGTDDLPTRYLVNRTAARLRLPLVAAALSQWEGQISLYDVARGTPCYACVFPQAPAPGLAPTCAEAGVLGPLPGVVGAMMAVEAVKQITGAGETLAGHLLIYDALHAENRRIALRRRDDCPVCGPA